MISEIQIGNFKAFGPAQTIPLRPITLVFGPNSAGKSSIIQGLLLARHIHDTGNADAHQTTLGGAAVDLGGFAKYVRNHDGELKTSIQFAFKRSNQFEDGPRFHYLDNFRMLSVTYALGMNASGQPSSEVGIQSVTLCLDERELVRLVRSASGELHVDESALLDGSLLSVENLWMPDAFECWNSGAERPPEFGNAERRHREAILRELSNMKFGATLGAFENLGDLPREYPDWETFSSDREMDSPQRGPFGFYKRYLEDGNSCSDDAKKTRDSEKTEAWAMALRYDIECLFEAAGDAIQQGLKSTTYLGPLRWIPPRLIPDGEQFDASWAAGGGHAWQRLRREPELLVRVNRFLQETLHSRYRLKCQHLAPELDAQTIELCVKRALESSAAAGSSASDPNTARVAEDPTPSVRAKASISDLAAALQSELRAQSSGEGLTELSLVDAESGLAVSHRDVGTGISQLLPVLVNTAGGRNQLIAIEQPELHLHPALQGELGDVFIESALGENKNTFLIETHSEHLILRLLRRVRETTEGTLTDPKLALRPDQISVLFVRPGTEGSQVVELPVTPDGDFASEWPGGFFAERFADLP